MRFYNTNDIPARLAEESFAANLVRLNPSGKAQLFGLSGLAHTRTINSIKHTWWAKQSKFPQVTVAANVADGTATSITVGIVATNTDDNLSFIVPNMILRVQQLVGVAVQIEHMYVQAVNYGTGVLTVVRGFGGTTPAAIPIGATLVAVGNAHGQGSDAPNPVSVMPTLYDNNTQIFRNSWGNSRTLDRIKMRAGQGATAENKLDAMFFHGAAIEEQILFGHKGVSIDSDGNPLTTMGGLEQIISDLAPQNISVADTAGTTFEDLESYLDPLLDFQVDGATKSELNMYVGKTSLKAINAIGKLNGDYQVTKDETSFGQRFLSFRTTRGEFNLIEHPILNTNTNWAKMAVVVDTAALDVMYLDKTFHEEITGTGKDAKAGVYTTELTLELQNPYSCGIIYNLTAGKASA